MKDYIIIPTYNEKENIGLLVEKIFSILPEINVLVVDDNSPDGTAAVVEDLQKKYNNLYLLKRPSKNGLGGAYIAGFREVFKSDDINRIIMMDGDFSHNPGYIAEMVRLSSDFDLIIGSRYVRGGGIEKWEFWRRILSIGGNMYVRLILGYKIHDWTSGFNCIGANFLRKINFDKIDLSGYAFLQELKYTLIKAGARVKEIPIIFEARRGGESKISGFIIREGITGPWKIRFKSN